DGFAFGRAAGFAGTDHLTPAFGQHLAQRRQHGGLAGALAALEADEETGHQRHRLSWWQATARLCSASVDENTWLPSPRDTKYRVLPGSGFAAASSAARPGMAIGVGGRPPRV